MEKQVPLYIFLLLFCFSCDSSDKPLENLQEGEFIYRNHDEYLFVPPPPEKTPSPTYPWQKNLVGHLPKITKEFFRCKGSELNPEKDNHFTDCGGSAKHSLPLRNGKEFIYPVLLTLLNTLQAETEQKVVVTCGHRCPQHNSYVNPAVFNQNSKHMIGAEVSFYIQGMEHEPEKIVQMLMDTYKNHPDPDFSTFNRYEKTNTNVSIKPWFNKEIFIKLFNPTEGRNLDNRHPYPYIGIQVRYDTSLNERVTYSWDSANKNYLRN